ncbi:mediator of RNA polymerase II transcription subunit 17 [Diutina catenulata]
MGVHEGSDPFIQHEDKLSLAELIPRILYERKSFLDISEESLQAEIDEATKKDASQSQDPSPDHPYDEFAPTDDPTDPLEKFDHQTLELTTNINSAVNEVQLSLDFVSLLLSSVRSSDKMTISPHLQKNVPMGSLASDRLAPEAGEEAKVSSTQKEGEKLGRGWKLESLRNATKLFRESQRDLDAQVSRERAYWSAVNEVLANREVLYKTRDPESGQRVIGVKYGYGDSGSSYYDKGLAILRKDENGGITVTPVTASNRIVDKIHRYVRVRILSSIDGDYMVTGQSTLEYSAHPNGLVEVIERARYFLFEEDLFYQLTREAKTLINYNVSIISNKIIIEVNQEIIEIESVVYDESADDDYDYQNINQYSSLNNRKCQRILTYLKIMLCCYYKYNLSLKQKLPTTLTKWKQTHSHPLILRPLLGNIRHELNLTRMTALVESCMGQHQPKVAVDKYRNLRADGRPRTNPFQKSVERPSSMVTVVLKNASGECLDIRLELTTNEIFVNLIVNLTIIRYPSEEKLDKNLGGTNVLSMSFNDFNDLSECLGWTVESFVSG